VRSGDVTAEQAVQETGPAASGGDAYSYAINLRSSLAPTQADSLPALEALRAYRVYSTSFRKDGQLWHRLRLGFFDSRADATAVLEDLRAYYPEAWITGVTAEERRHSAADLPGSPVPAAATTVGVTPEAAVVSPGPDSSQQPGPAGTPVPAAATTAGVTPEAAAVSPGPDSSQQPGPAGSPVPAAATTAGVTPEAAAVSPGPDSSQQPGPGRALPGQLDELMEAAREKMTAQDYAGAIRLYTKVLQYPETGHSRDALEYLGLAREQKGQVAHAKQAYEDYLERYPKGAGAERVSQRLAALVTASKRPRGKLRTVKARGEQDTSWDLYGGYSQFYRRDVNTTGVDKDDEETTVSQSSVSSDMDMTGRMRSRNYNLRTRFTGGYLHDFLDDSSGSDTTVSSVYFDAQEKKYDMSMRIGRQSRSSGGVLGRFDGLLLGIPLGNVATLSPVGGFPVDSSTDGLDTDRYFYGVTLEFDGFANGWDANTFIIEQRLDGITDRRAVGGELRYFDPTRSFFSLVDYDIYYKKLNIWQFLGNWTAPDKTTVNLILDYRNSPILTTNNALTGQAVSSIDDLLDSFSNSEIEDIARDRTATSKLATLGASRPINGKLQLSGDVTVTNLSDTNGSAGVEAMDGTGNEYFYNLQLTGSNLIKAGDIAILGVRYANADTTRTTSLSLNTRYPFSRKLRVNPRLRVDYRNNTTDDTDQFIYRPSLRLTYRAKGRLQLEAEAGGEWSDREIVDGSEKDRSYFAIIGYRMDF
jgi:tetratricopeptide (TPR) repeat protein